MEKPIRTATSLDEIVVKKSSSSSFSPLTLSSTSLSSQQSSTDSINSAVKTLKRALDSKLCANKSSDKDRDYADLKESLRNNFEKITVNDNDELIVGNLSALHAIEQSLLNHVIPNDLQWQAILLAGLPGTGKTKLMKSSAIKIAKLLKKPVSVVVVKPGDLYNKYLGQTEKTPQALYEVAREMKPTIVLIDEVDGLMRTRSENESDQSRRFKNALLQEIQGARSMSKVLTLCSTNKPADIDSSFIRRFSKIFIIGLPSPSERTQIFKKFLDQYNKVVTVNYDLINFDCIQKCSEGFTGDDIRKVVSLTANNNCKVSSNGKLLQYKDIENIRHQLESSLDPVKMIPVAIETCHLESACEEVGVSYKPKDIKELNKFASDFKLFHGKTMEEIHRTQYVEHEDGDTGCNVYDFCNPC